MPITAWAFLIVSTAQREQPRHCWSISEPSRSPTLQVLVKVSGQRYKMAMHTITLNLPETVYEQIQQAAEKAQRRFGRSRHSRCPGDEHSVEPLACGVSTHGLLQ